MSTSLPVPVSFRLPSEAWRSLDPDSVGVTDALFLAVRREHEGDYAPTLTLSGGERDDTATLEQIGDEALAVFAEQASDTELVSRREYGAESAPGLLQVVGGTLHAEGQRYDLRQAHVLLGMVDTDDPRRRVVLKVVLSTTYAQFETHLPELQSFVASLRPGQGPAH